VNEAAARNVLLVRAFEAGTVSPEIWSDDDRAWASRAAAEVVGAGGGRDAFLARRAALAVERLGSRHRSVLRALRAVEWRPWVGWVVVTAAFVLGLAIDAIGPGKRINVLAFPHMGLLAWNFAVYTLIATRAGARIAKISVHSLGPIARVVARAGHAVAGDAPPAPREAGVTSALAAFARDWTQATARLVAARIARVLHIAAAAFAVGAIAGLYMRGLAFEYRAGWESTFLGPEQAHWLLSIVLGPAAALTGIELPGAAHFAELRFSAGDGENAAPWIHLYAATFALFVLLPRALLAVGAWLAERRLATRFPLRLEEAYFQRLVRGFRGEAAQVHVVPYGYVPSPRATLALNSLVGRVFGPQSVFEIASSVPFGGEEAIPPDAVPTAPLALVIALFAMTATPEPENQGAFVEVIAGRLASGVPLIVIVDESGFAQRFAGDPGRRAERQDAWRRMFAGQAREPVFADLETADSGHAERELARALDKAHAPEVAV
jgi:Protein of unknown function (DUF2868)